MSRIITFTNEDSLRMHLAEENKYWNIAVCDVDIVEQLHKDFPFRNIWSISANSVNIVGTERDMVIVSQNIFSATDFSQADYEEIIVYTKEGGGSIE